jgi:hypothetical protein
MLLVQNSDVVAVGGAVCWCLWGVVMVVVVIVGGDFVVVVGGGRGSRVAAAALCCSPDEGEQVLPRRPFSQEKQNYMEDGILRLVMFG